MNTPPMDPSPLVETAKRLYENGGYPEAAAAFAEAAQVFASAGESLMAAEMKNNQAVALLRSGEAEIALRAVEGTQQVFSAVGDNRRLGMAYANLASCLEALKRFPEAIEAYEAAGKSLVQAGEDQMHFQVQQLLASLYLRRWKFLNAVIALQAGLADLKDPTPRQKLMKKILSFRL